MIHSVENDGVGCYMRQSYVVQDETERVMDDYFYFLVNHDRIQSELVGNKYALRSHDFFEPIIANRKADMHMYRKLKYIVASAPFLSCHPVYIGNLALFCS